MTNFCLVCQSTSFYTTISNYDDYTNHKFEIEICNNCLLGKTIYPTNIDLFSYCPKKYYGNLRKRFSLIFEFISVVFRISRILTIIVNTKKNIINRSILDIGCGRAIELKYLNKLGWKCYGTEYDIGNYGKNRMLK